MEMTPTLLRSTLILLFLALYASILSAQIRPGACINFITDTHGTIVALADTCRQDTIYIGANAYSGPWVFRAGAGVTLSVAPAADVLSYQTIITPAQVVIFEGDTVSVPADTTVVERMVHGRDTIIFTASSSAGGRTFITDARATLRPPGTIDSTTEGLYKLDYGFGTINQSGFANFSNNGSGGADSTGFSFPNQSGFMLFVDNAYPLMFTHFVVKTSFTSGNEAYTGQFPTNIVGANSDSCLFSAHLKTEFSGGIRRYYLRIYKLHRASITGVAIPHNLGALVCSHEITENRFPAYGTSVQARVELYIRRL